MSPALLPDPSCLQLDCLSAHEGTIRLTLRTTADAARCPLCHHSTSRMHSRYVRTLADLPWLGVPVTIRLTLRRFICTNATCERRIFAERIPSVVAPYARRTLRCTEVVALIGFVAGGEPGARLLAGLAMSQSPDTILRAIRQAMLPSSETPRVLGVDDFAFRRGHTYGTILIDLERHCRVDLLADRKATTLAEWLVAHPGVEIISRDRGGAYADGGRQGAPDALQVADRFHVVKNLREMVERLLVRHHRALRGGQEPTSAEATELPDAAEETEAKEGAEPTTDTGVPEPVLSTRDGRQAAARRARRVARYQEVQRLRAEGLSLRTIAVQMGLARGTVCKLVHADAFPERHPRARYPSIMDPYEDYVRQRWEEGCQNATQLWRELRDRGFTGSLSNVRARIATWRTTPALKGRPRGTAAKASLRPRAPKRTPKTVSWLLVTAPEDRTAEEQQYVEQMAQRCPEVGVLIPLVQGFLRIVRARDDAALDDWLRLADESGIQEVMGFAGGVQRDRAAIDAMLTTAWSNGQTEGQVNRLKTIKRMMYGRAKFDLLRQRVLYAA